MLRTLSTHAKKRTFGAHQFGLCKSIKNNKDGCEKLRLAAETAVKAGAKLLELACPPFMELPAEIVASILHAAGIKEVAFCIVYTTTEGPGPEKAKLFLSGDPASSEPKKFERAADVFWQHLTYISLLQTHGIKVHHITGPSCFVIGETYAENVCSQAVKFYKQFVPELGRLNLRVNIEFLRPGEDNGALERLENVIWIIEALGGLASPFRWHADIHHMLERKKNPSQLIAHAGSYLGYLHAHDRLRGRPGGEGGLDWERIGQVLDSIGYEGPIVPEPFCEEIRLEIPPLGAGLLAAEPVFPYYQGARTYFELQLVVAPLALAA